MMFLLLLWLLLLLALLVDVFGFNIVGFDIVVARFDVFVAGIIQIKTIRQKESVLEVKWIMPVQI